MRKIEKLNGAGREFATVQFKDLVVVIRKLNEVIDTVNELREKLKEV